MTQQELNIITQNTNRDERAWWQNWQWDQDQEPTVNPQGKILLSPTSTEPENTPDHVPTMDKVQWCAVWLYDCDLVVFFHWHHLIFFSRPSGTPASIPRFWCFLELITFTIRCIGYLHKCSDQPLCLVRITRAKCQLWQHRASCLSRKRALLDTADLVGHGGTWRIIGMLLQGFCSCLRHLSTLGVISYHSLVDLALFLVSVCAWCPFCISWASDFYALRHKLLFSGDLFWCKSLYLYVVYGQAELDSLCSNFQF